MQLSFDKLEASYRVQSLEELRGRVFAHYPEYSEAYRLELFRQCLQECDRLAIVSEQGEEAFVLASFHIGEVISNCPGYDRLHTLHAAQSGSPDVVPTAFLAKMHREAEVL